MSARRIIGIVLVRNEDAHVRFAVENIRAFCDRVLLVDHQSTDHTPQILREFAEDTDRFELHPVRHPRQSHDLLKPYTNTGTWIFAADGDEIYDPDGLRKIRTRLLEGEFDAWWMLLGNVLNCDWIDLPSKSASGWLAPPCRSITKLYNFNAITAWDGDTPERLHGGVINFKTGYAASQRLNLFEQYDWDATPLRCLHTCFMRRSSIDPAASVVRENIIERFHPKLRRRFRQWWQKLGGAPSESDWKKSRYMRGDRVTKDASAFFPA